MIVRHVDGRLLLITQPDHAHAAGRVMADCASLERHSRRDSILNAVTEHDGGWAVEDEAPRVSTTGDVLDFISAPTEVRQGVWPRSVARLAGDDPWAAALVAQHALTVYGRLRDRAEWTSFFDRMTTIRDELLARVEPPLAELEADYTFVRLGDLISLAFCTGTDELTPFGNWKVQLTGRRVTIRPDLFDGAAIPIHISARSLPDRSFSSDTDLLGELRNAETVTLDGIVSG